MTTSPTIVLVHGAFAESASWNGVITRLREHDLSVIAAANPLRSLSGDADVVAGLVSSLDGPVVLVGHSYGGQVISNAVRGDDRVKALVFVAAFAPEEGESIAELSGRFPGSTLGDTLNPVPLPDGSTDLYIRQERYHAQFAADLTPERAALDAVTQRPLNDRALHEKSGPPAWRDLPSWFVYPELDFNIPLAAHRFMAERAGAREQVEIAGASHALPASQPTAVADVILKAVQTVA
ncbi:pimeloyl-ACP methyl ester carboxylesterase [Nonomuraea polychroma]|uniref:Pimeloyl-ACP methyl ester carboxylesterase n=1 Tax=Nonomuraea polychroma TaxID=46176 RepID=A0A438LWM8_9ACTN|nr:alpha/beta hydrolase [Nonomuraea polychroma]RVX37871.1 pimeloyl-ACP methyl ester carboxylesterase [Nonomuraea polychroma]